MILPANTELSEIIIYGYRICIRSDRISSLDSFSQYNICYAVCIPFIIIATAGPSSRKGGSILVCAMSPHQTVGVTKVFLHHFAIPG